MASESTGRMTRGKTYVRMLRYLKSHVSTPEEISRDLKMELYEVYPMLLLLEDRDLARKCDYRKLDPSPDATGIAYSGKPFKYKDPEAHVRITEKGKGVLGYFDHIAEPIG